MTKGCATRTRHIQRARKCGKLPRGKNLPRTHTHVLVHARSHTSHLRTHTYSPASVDVYSYGVGGVLVCVGVCVRELCLCIGIYI